MATPRGRYCVNLSIFISEEVDTTLTLIVRKLEDRLGQKRIKQAVVDAMLQIAAKDDDLHDKVADIISA